MVYQIALFAIRLAQVTFRII